MNLTVFRYSLPSALVDRDKVYQFASLSVMGDNSLGDIEKMRASGWTPTLFKPSSWEGFTNYKITPEGYIEIGGLMLMEKDRATAQFSAEDERVKPLVIEAISRRALGGTNAVFDGGTVRRAFEEAKAAYDDVPFRNANREAIIKRAHQLARRAGQTPEMMVSTEAPVPCRLEGMALWFFNEARLLPVWRMFEPLAIVQVREEQETERRQRQDEQERI